MALRATESCSNGDHEACVVSIYPTRLRDCVCRCHRQAINVEHKPTSRDPRVRSRQKNWQGSKWYVNAFPAPPKVTVDESIIQEPLTREELWQRLQNGA